jgi:hypothetical protein
MEFLKEAKNNSIPINVSNAALQKIFKKTLEKDPRLRLYAKNLLNVKKNCFA